MELTPIFVTGIIFGFAYSVIFLFIRRSERFKILDKGVDASAFLTPRNDQNFTALKFGLLFIGAAVGIFAGNIFTNIGFMQEEAAYFSMIFLFGGLGLVINHFIEKKERKEGM